MFPKLSDATAKGEIFVGPQNAAMSKSETPGKMSFEKKKRGNLSVVSEISWQ